jgi:hypothetical protein
MLSAGSTLTFWCVPKENSKTLCQIMVSFFSNLFLIMWRTQMKALILAAAATLFMAGAVNAADEDMSMKKMTPTECTAAMAECKDDACKQKLKDNNGCSMEAPAAAQ